MRIVIIMLTRLPPKVNVSELCLVKLNTANLRCLIVATKRIQKKKDEFEDYIRRETDGFASARKGDLYARAVVPTSTEHGDMEAQTQRHGHIDGETEGHRHRT